MLTAILERQNKRLFDSSLEATLKRKAEEFLGLLAQGSMSAYESEGMALALVKSLLDTVTNNILRGLST